ncbi:kinase-like domain-containing protein, partial [Pisolithus sp. B1]
GEVIHVCNVHTNEEFTAKFSPVNDTDSILQHEYEVLSKLQGIAGIPHITSFGKEASHSVMVFECLGPLLEEVFHSCHWSFLHHTIAAIGEQLIHCLQNIHLCSYIHQDVKPSNILIGTGQDASTIYLVDFSIVKPYQDPHTHLHNTFSKCGGFLGSPAFASINTHLGLEAGRQDDLESLSYLLIYLACGSLPWLGHTPCLENNAIINMKRDIFQCGDIPKVLLTLLSYS